MMKKESQRDEDEKGSVKLPQFNWNSCLYFQIGISAGTGVMLNEKDD